MCREYTHGAYVEGGQELVRVGQLALLARSSAIHSGLARGDSCPLARGHNERRCRV